LIYVIVFGANSDVNQLLYYSNDNTRLMVSTFFSRATWVSQHQKHKSFWVSWSKWMSCCIL